MCDIIVPEKTSDEGLNMGKNMFERCLALTEEDKQRNLENEELDLERLDWENGEEMDETPKTENKREKGILDYISPSNFTNPQFREEIIPIIMAKEKVI